MAILIISSPQDMHIQKVKEILESRGQEVCVLHTGSFPQHLAVTTFSDGQTCDLKLRGKEVDYFGHDFQSVWIRRTSFPKRTDLWGETLNQYSGSQNLMHFFLKSLEGLNSRFIPGKPRDISFWEDKVTQIPVALEVGFEIPDTIVTNDPHQVIEFYKDHASVISKSGTRAPLATSETTTKNITPEDLIYLQRVKNYPVIFQEKVEKAADLRVVVIGEKIFASRIDTQQTARGKTDWRAAFVRTETEYELPAEIKSKCLAMARKMGLTYSAIDLVLTPEGKYVFIELNPAGQWLWMEIELGMPISQTIADFLMMA